MCFASRLPHATALQWQSIVWSGELLKAVCRCVTPVQPSAMKWRVCCLRPAISAGHRWCLNHFLEMISDAALFRSPNGLSPLCLQLANWLFKRECILCSNFIHVFSPAITVCHLCPHFVMRSMTMWAHYLGFPSFVTEGPLFSIITHRLRLHFNLGRLKINSAEDKFRILRLGNVWLKNIQIVLFSAGGHVCVTTFGL